LKGTYTILIVCKQAFRTRLGRLGLVNVEKGFCLYTGSALGDGAVSLEGRLNRHFRASKKRRWHVDYLTSHPKCSVSFAVYVKSPKHLECSVNQAIARALDVKALLPHAGSSDCRCQSHLTRVMSLTSEREIFRALAGVYRGFGKPVKFSGKAAR